MIKIETARLIIRDHIEDDLKPLHRILSDEAVMRYLDFGSKTIEDSEHSLKTSIEESLKNFGREKYYFALIEKQNGLYIGEIGFTVIKKSETGGICDLGYFILSEFWNKGFVTEAAKQVVDFIFENTGLHKIETGCVKDNIGSERVMIKCGFHKEAELLKHSLIKGEWKDRLKYGMLKSDWEKIKVD
jgi:ribosomal-protein-alanine N-acetyltransferase